MPAGLVVDNDKLAVPLVDPVHPAFDDDRAVWSGPPPFHRDGSIPDVQLTDIVGQPTLRLPAIFGGLLGPGEPVAFPVLPHQSRGSFRRALFGPKIEEVPKD